MRTMWIGFVMAAALVSAAGMSDAETVAVAEGNAKARLTDTVRAWRADPACPADMANLTDVDIRISALGPGRHGWLARFVQADRIAGHMIVSATPEGGLQLTACGSGDVPPDLP